MRGKNPILKKLPAHENLVAEYFNVSPMGNWKKGNNILFASYTPQEFAVLKKQTPGQFISLLNKTKKDIT